jgi:hypothetical protein
MTIPIYDVSAKNAAQDIEELSKGFPALQPEIWKDYDHRYIVSTEGRVFDTRRMKIIKPCRIDKGYAGGGIHGYGRTFHPMILKTFVPNPWPGYYTMCDHINGDRFDPRLENLRWSNINLNGINRKDVKGYWATKHKGKLTGKYGTSVKVQGKQCHLGTFSSPVEARKAYFEGVERAFEILEI